MGNMIFNKRVEDWLRGENQDVEYRVFPQQMYTGPLKLGDPNFRGLLKREQDPLITQRMRECATRELCKNFRLAVNDCGKEYGQFYRAWNYGTGGCRKEADELADCVQSWLDSEDLREMMTLEYLNERSHYRQTGIKTVRYGMDRKYIDRDERIHGPTLDENGCYRPRKPKDWDKTYKGENPPWTDFQYGY